MQQNELRAAFVFAQVNASIDPVPLSWSDIKATGALSDDKGGWASLYVLTACKHDTMRPHWPISGVGGKYVYKGFGSKARIIDSYLIPQSFLESRRHSRCLKSWGLRWSKSDCFPHSITARREHLVKPPICFLRADLLQ